jgi:hypothetical protein
VPTKRLSGAEPAGDPKRAGILRDSHPIAEFFDLMAAPSVTDFDQTP